MRGRDTRHRLSWLRTGNLQFPRLRRERSLRCKQPLPRKAHPVSKALLSPETGAAPENQQPPGRPRVSRDFPKTKKTGAPARNRPEGALQALQVPCWGGGSGFQTQKEGVKAADPSLLLPSNPDSLIRQITTLRGPHTYTHTGIQEKLTPQIQGEFGEVRLKPRARTTRAAAAPAQCPGTCD